MSSIRLLVSIGVVWFWSAGASLAQSPGYTVGDVMPTPNKEHFVFTFSIKCSDTDSARVDRYEHDGETMVVVYRNDSKNPYGYLLAHSNTLLLDNNPQDGNIDAISVVGPEDDIKICGVLPQ